MDGRTAAATLGVGPRATRDEIRRAFRARAKVLHPDAGPAGSMDRFIVLRQAADRLLVDAPEAPVPAAPTPPAGSARFDGVPARSTRHGGAIDLTDTVRRPRPDRQAPAAHLRSRDARAQSFEDCLAAALSRS